MRNSSETDIVKKKEKKYYWNRHLGNKGKAEEVTHHQYTKNNISIRKKDTELFHSVYNKERKIMTTEFSTTLEHIKKPYPKILDRDRAKIKTDGIEKSAEWV